MGQPFKRSTHAEQTAVPRRDQAAPPYKSRRHLLTPGERRFFLNGLQPAVANRYLISFKVRLADVITTVDWDSPHGRRISQKHVDFVLATPRTTRIVAVVELNDATHDSDHRQQRDAFLAEALKAAAIPLVAIPIYRTYDPIRIRRWILTAIDNLPKTDRSGKAVDNS